MLRWNVDSLHFYWFAIQTAMAKCVWERVRKKRRRFTGDMWHLEFYRNEKWKVCYYDHWTEIRRLNFVGGVTSELIFIFSDLNHLHVVVALLYLYAHFYFWPTEKKKCSENRKRRIIVRAKEKKKWNERMISCYLCRITWQQLKIAT